MAEYEVLIAFTGAVEQGAPPVFLEKALFNFLHQQFSGMTHKFHSKYGLDMIYLQAIVQSLILGSSTAPVLEKLAFLKALDRNVNDDLVSQTIEL